MRKFLRDTGKEFLANTPYIREQYFEREFLRTPPCCKGIYRSFADAEADSRHGKLIGYNHKEVAKFYESDDIHLNPADYPVLFWMTRALPGAQVVFELGGGIGQGYHAYLNYLSLPPQLRWIICDVPELALAGREIARERNEDLLIFTDQRETAEDIDIYATFGALQYIEEPFSRIIEKLRVKPRYLLINRVPLWDGASFITLQNSGHSVAPYRVDNQSDFVGSIRALDYELLDSWKINRSFSVLMHPEYTVSNYHGMYFCLK